MADLDGELVIRNHENSFSNLVLFKIVICIWSFSVAAPTQVLRTQTPPNQFLLCANCPRPNSAHSNYGSVGKLGPLFGKQLLTRAEITAENKFTANGCAHFLVTEQTLRALCEITSDRRPSASLAESVIGKKNTRHQFATDIPEGQQKTVICDHAGTRAKTVDQ